jgi:hypothetical protein
MPITVTMLQTRQGEGGVLWTAGNSYSASDAFGAYLITSNLATGTLPLPLPTSLSPAQGTEVIALVSGNRIADTTSRNITADDNARTLAPTGTLTYTIPAWLSPMPSFTVDCPASGIITVAVSGGATLNGGLTPVTRIRAANPVGFVVLAHSETNSYGISGV